MSVKCLPVLLVDEMEVERKQHKKAPNHAETSYSQTSATRLLMILNLETQTKHLKWLHLV
jgi:hypothetical protein